MERIAKDETEAVRQPGDERSKINIAEREMIAARDVIEFIAEVAVAASKEHL